MKPPFSLAVRMIERDRSVAIPEIKIANLAISVDSNESLHRNVFRSIPTARSRLRASRPDLDLFSKLIKRSLEIKADESNRACHYPLGLCVRNGNCDLRVVVRPTSRKGPLQCKDSLNS